MLAPFADEPDIPYSYRIVTCVGYGSFALTYIVALLNPYFGYDSSSTHQQVQEHHNDEGQDEEGNNMNTFAQKSDMKYVLFHKLFQFSWIFLILQITLNNLLDIINGNDDNGNSLGNIFYSILLVPWTGYIFVQQLFTGKY